MPARRPKSAVDRSQKSVRFGGGFVCNRWKVAADHIIAVADALGVGTFTVAAIGIGAAVAAQLPSQRVIRFIIADTPAIDGEKIAPDIPLHLTGAHWVQAWLMLRDGQIYAPWYDGRVAAQRRTQGCFDAGWLQDQTAAFMEGRETYARLARAGADVPALEILSQSRKPLFSLREAQFIAGSAEEFQWEPKNAVNA